MVLYKHKGMRKNLIASSYFFKINKKQSGHLSFAYLGEEYKIYAILIQSNEFKYKESFAITPIDLNIFLFFLFTMSTKSQEDLIVYYFTISQLSTPFWQKRYINKYQNGHNHRKDIVEINEYMSHSELEKWKLISFLALQNGPNNI